MLRVLLPRAAGSGLRWRPSRIPADFLSAASRSMPSRATRFELAAFAPHVGHAAYATNAGGRDAPPGRPIPDEDRSKQETDHQQAEREGEKVEMSKGADNVQFTWGSAIFTCAMCAGCLLYYEYLRHRKETETRAITRSERIGVPKLGGPFELTDRKGVVRTDADFKGQFLLIYFGFSFCPDICPVEMDKQTRAIELLDAEFGAVATPVFISVDPKRDTPEVVDEYCKEFHPRIVGLTGTPEQVKAVSRAYRVYFHANTTTDKEYLIDHSIIHYFMGKNGKFIDFFGKNMTAQEMADKMKQAILEQKDKDQDKKDQRGVKDMDEDK